MPPLPLGAEVPRPPPAGPGRPSGEGRPLEEGRGSQSQGRRRAHLSGGCCVPPHARPSCSAHLGTCTPRAARGCERDPGAQGLGAPRQGSWARAASQHPFLPRSGDSPSAFAGDALFLTRPCPHFPAFRLRRGLLRCHGCVFTGYEALELPGRQGAGTTGRAALPGSRGTTGGRAVLSPLKPKPHQGCSAAWRPPSSALGEPRIPSVTRLLRDNRPASRPAHGPGGMRRGFGPRGDRSPAS